MSVGGGKSKGSTSSSSISNAWDYGTNVWGAQSPYLEDLYARTQANLGAGDGGAAQYLGAASQGLTQSNASMAGANDALSRFLTPQEDPALQAYATNLGQQFNEQFLPGLKGDAALAGGLGGSRQQIGAALGAQRAMQSLGDFTAQTYAGGQDRALQAALGMGENAAQFAGQYANNAQGQLALADFARSMPWYNLGQYAGLLGPTVTQDLGSYSTSSSTSKGSQSGWNASFGKK